MLEIADDRTEVSVILHHRAIHLVFQSSIFPSLCALEYDLPVIFHTFTTCPGKINGTDT